ncbi:hydrogenase nickel incorporation protein HypB [Marinobacterium sedimentorum]|uniref:hydrogenase nickel incorporation protein HypB n=1 Tax=Marinobacterium sedimentorum TaxID=2927804 RepID=UPI0020C5F429|nr:hydrogenase nickel incorporation protein HypB [Marinobacterium sedimentorum]MCP8690343.1 hydrogenase nickel incorporation protein HypB [Marinobacterium sedimentorum]
MCGICGCDLPEPRLISEFPRAPLKITAAPQTITLHQDLLHANRDQAALNRDWFSRHRLSAINLVSSPGAGKTTLLEQTLTRLRGRRGALVIEGDQQTELDAARIRATGTPAVQIQTGQACHLDASMVHRALHQLPESDGALLLIENVGNLICPAMFDLGEKARVVLVSVTEGDDKPLKYPSIFHHAELLLITKTDLLPHVEFNIQKCIEYARRIQPDLPYLELCATRGDGMAAWLDWLEAQ